MSTGTGTVRAMDDHATAEPLDDVDVIAAPVELIAGPPRWLGPAVAGALVVADQVVKYVVEQVLEPGVFVPWLSDRIGWQLVYNDGAAFGLPLPWWAFLVVASAVVIVVWRNLPRVVRVVPVVAYGMLTAGALGNVVDRLVRTGDPGDPRFLHGHVVDFVAWGTFPRFNVADAAITVGFVLLAWDLWRHDDQEALPGGPSGTRG